MAPEEWVEETLSTLARNRGYPPRKRSIRILRECLIELRRSRIRCRSLPRTLSR